MFKNNIYDDHLIKDGKKVKRVYLIYVDAQDEKRECDGCDEKKPLASIVPICGDVMCICQDCLSQFVEVFGRE